MTLATPTAPDYTPWWDDTATVASILAQLRLSASDPDAAWITALVGAAGAQINAFLDRPDPTPPQPLEVAQAALEQAVVEAYRRKDVGTGDPTDYSVAAIVTRYGATDLLGNVRAQLMPCKRRFGTG